jgi:hypothetical protein
MKKHRKHLSAALLLVAGICLLKQSPYGGSPVPPIPVTFPTPTPSAQPAVVRSEATAAHTANLPHPAPAMARRASDPPKGLSQKDWSSINGAMHHFQHTIKEQDGLHWARNVGEKYRAKIDDRGVTLDPDGGGWQWGLELRSYAVDGQTTDIPAATARKADGQRIDLDRGQLTEWYLNDHGGLEHGWTIQTPLAASETVTFHLAPRGDYTTTVAEDQKSATFTDPTGTPRIRYDALKAYDATGKALTATFSSGDENGSLLLAVNTTGATYPIVIDPLIQQVIAPPQGMKSDFVGQGFGESVAIDGNTVVVGSPSGGFFTSSGEAVVFTRTGTTWSQQAYLTAANAGADDFFGESVAISGDTIVVGALLEDSTATGSPNEGAPESGAAYVFTRSGGTWTQQAFLKASNAGARDQFGRSVAIAGDTIVVGALFEDSTAAGSPNEGAPRSGAAYVFTRSGGTWTQQAFLKASNADANDEFGSSVAISGDTIVVGARLEDSTATGSPNEGAPESGAAYVFTRSGGTWTQQAFLKASNAEEEDRFGSSVAIAGDTIVVGALREDSTATGGPNEWAPESGAAYVFTRSGGTWIQQAFLKASNAGADDFFGWSVAIAGDTIVVGALLEDSTATGGPNEGAPQSGAAYVFTKISGTWGQRAFLKASNAGEFDQFGSSVAISGDIIIAGAPRERSNKTGVTAGAPDEAATGNGAPDSGAGYIFVRNSGIWSQEAYLKAPGGSNDDRFGSAVDISGDTVVVGAYTEDGGTRTINGNQADNSRPNSGAAYVFVRNRGFWSLQSYLKASNGASNERFGNAVAIDGDTIVVGASQETTNGANSGAIYVFIRTGSTWSEQAFLTGFNTQTDDFFGSSVAIDGNRIVAGAPGEDGDNFSSALTTNENAPSAGAAYVFLRTGTTWAADGYLKANNAGTNDSFGTSVGITTIVRFSGGIGGITFTPHIVVGAPWEGSSATTPNGAQDEGKPGSGAAYVYTRSGNSNWPMQAFLKASNSDLNDGFGRSVAIDGGSIVVGAVGEDSINGLQGDNSGVGFNITTSVGAAYVFTGSSATWSQQQYLKASNAGEEDSFGNSVAISGNTIVIGAEAEKSSGLSSNNSLLFAGAAYRYTRSGTVWTETDYLKSISGARDFDQFGWSVAVDSGSIAVGSLSLANTVSIFQTDPYETWAAPFFPDLNAANAARTADPDGDGVSNLLESIAGTDPLNAASLLRATALSTAGGNLGITFQTVSGKFYRLMKTTDLRNYSLVPGQDSINATGASTTINLGPITPGSPRQFYRLEVLLP